MKERKEQKKPKTFLDFYNEARARRSKPSVEFINKIAEITNRQPITVRKWLSGENTPDINCQEIIANYLGAPREELFPPKDDKS